MSLDESLRRRKIEGLERGHPVLAATGLRILDLDRGRAAVQMPLGINANHVGTFYAGSLFVLAEVAGAALCAGSFDSGRVFPLVKDMRIRYRRPAKSDVTARVALSESEIDATLAEVDRVGKADLAWQCELRGEAEEVVAIVDCVFQIRSREGEGRVTTARLSLVTGANKGIGFETARQLGRAGHQVLVGARDPERGRRAVERLEAEGLDVRLRVLDVADPASIAAAARSVERDFGRLDVLVNNAAVGLVRVPPSEVDAADLRAVLDTNFFGAVETVKAFLPLLRASDAGRIVNVSSALGSISNLADPDWKAYQRLFTPYSVSKAALNAFTALLSAELIDTEIKVNAVEPGFTATDMTQQRGPRTPEQAARVVVRYATLASSGPTGGYFDESGRLAW